MKENSIEEALEKLSTGKKIKMYELLRTFKREGIENFVITRKKYVDVILSDYKRVLKENEELKNNKTLVENCKKCIIRDELDEYVNNSISVQTIKAKIEELDIEISTCEYADDDSEEYKQEIEKDKAELLIAKKVLQQLLEESGSE